MTQAAASFRRAPFPMLTTYVLGGGLALAAVLVLGDEVARHIDAFETAVEGLGPWAVVAFVPLYAVLSSVFVPDTLLGIVAGASFGLGRGSGAVVAGSLLGAAMQYGLARTLLRPTIERAVSSKPALRAIQTAVLQQEFRLQFMIRLTPINRAMTSYTLGAAGVRFARFLAAGVGLLPSLFLEVYFGYAGKHLTKVAGGSAHTAGLHEIALVVGFLFAVAALVVVSRAARKAVEEALRAPHGPPSGGTVGEASIG